MLRRFFGLGVAALFTAAVGAQEATRADAVNMQKKLAAIAEHAAHTSPTGHAPVRTAFTDREVNAYFKFDGREFLPEGLVDPEITIEDHGRVHAKAVVDLDAALQPQKRSFFDPLAWLRGRTSVTASGVVRAAGGQGVLQLQTATLGGVTIPKSLLQQLVTYYTKTPDSPEGFNLDSPFELPSGIQAVETSRGLATVLQP